MYGLFAGTNKVAVVKRRPLVDLSAPPKLWRKIRMLMQLLGVEGSKKKCIAGK